MEISAYKVYSEPNWEYELVACILEKDGKREEESLKARKFLMNQKEIEELLANIKDFKGKVLNRVLPLLENYPDIKPYFMNNTLEENGRARHILAALASRKELAKEHTAEEIDSLMLDIFDDWAKTIDETTEKEGKFKDLADIIAFLKGLEEDDSAKFRFIMLYTERHTALPKIQEFVKQGVEVLKEYYPVIKADFEKAVSNLQDRKNMEAYLDKLEVIKLGDVESMIVQPCIVTYNQLSIACEDNGEVMADTGIYMLLPDVMVNNFAGNDGRIISALKALGDTTRLKIIHMLSGKKMYIQEIADDLGLTPATVSHHMNILLQERLISITVDAAKAKKIFYEMNASQLKDLGEAIRLLGTLAEGNPE